MQIQEAGLKFNGPLYPRKLTRRIVIHHSASGLDVDAAKIHTWHLARGWAGIGYHYIILPNGTIQRGRPEDVRGAHAYQDARNEANTDGIGICLIGNFEKNVPTTDQINSLVWLIKDIQSRYYKLQVIGHKDIMPTACPGKYLYPLLEQFNQPEWKIVHTGYDAKLVDGNYDGITDTYIPLRGFFEALGYQVGWDNNTREAIVLIENKEVHVSIDTDVIRIKGGDLWQQDK